MEKSFFAQYSEERLGQTVLENEHGFITIDISDKFYIEHVFIKPESRGKSEADILYIDAIEIAKSKGFKEVFGSVFIKARNAEKSATMLLARKFKFSHLVGQMIYFKKEV